MDTLIYILDLPFVERLGWVLAHFLWQGALIGFICVVALRTKLGRKATAAYAVSVGGLFLCVLLPLITFCWITVPERSDKELVSEFGSIEVVAATYQNTSDAPSPNTEPVGSVFVPAARPGVFSDVGDVESQLTAARLWDSAVAEMVPYMRWLVFAWFPISCMMSFRLLWGWVLLRGCVHRAERASPEWQKSLSHLTEQIGLGVRVALLESYEIASPMVVACCALWC